MDFVEIFKRKDFLVKNPFLECFYAIVAHKNEKVNTFWKKILKNFPF